MPPDEIGAVGCVASDGDFSQLRFDDSDFQQPVLHFLLRDKSVRQKITPAAVSGRDVIRNLIDFRKSQFPVFVSGGNSFNGVGWKQKRFFFPSGFCVHFYVDLFDQNFRAGRRLLRLFLFLLNNRHVRQIAGNDLLFLELLDDLARPFLSGSRQRE